VCGNLLLSKREEERGKAMKVSTAIKNLQELNPDEQIIINWFSKSNFEDYFNDEDPITEEKWLSLAQYLENAEHFWEYNHYTLEAEIGNWQDLQEEEKEEE
jgi:hypothetical protein